MKDYVESFTESHRKNNERGNNLRMWDTQFNEESELTQEIVIGKIEKAGFAVNYDGNTMLLSKI